MDIFGDTSFWTTLAVIIFLGIVVYMKAPAAIGAALDKRSAAIKSEIDEAKRLRDEAQKLLTDYQKRQREAVQEAQGILAQARTEAELALKEARSDLAGFIERRKTQAEDKIARAEDEAIAEVRAHAARISVGAAERFIRERMDDSRADNLIDGAIAELPQRLKSRG